MFYYLIETNDFKDYGSNSVVIIGLFSTYCIIGLGQYFQRVK